MTREEAENKIFAAAKAELKGKRPCYEVFFCCPVCKKGIVKAFVSSISGYTYAQCCTTRGRCMGYTRKRQ